MSDKENISAQTTEWIHRLKASRKGTKRNVLQEVLIEFMESTCADKNDKRMLTLFNDNLRYLGNQKAFFSLMYQQNVFVECARFWIYWCLQYEPGDERIQKIDEGIGKVSTPSERRNLELYKKKITEPPRKRTLKDAYYWTDLKKKNVGELDSSGKYRTMYRQKDIYDLLTGKEVNSLEEIKAKKWRHNNENSLLKLRVAELEAAAALATQKVAPQETLPSPTVKTEDVSRRERPCISKDSFMIDTPQVPKVEEKLETDCGFTQQLTFDLGSNPSQEKAFAASSQERQLETFNDETYRQTQSIMGTELLTPVHVKPKLEIFQDEDSVDAIDSLTPLQPKIQGEVFQDLSTIDFGGACVAGSKFQLSSSPPARPTEPMTPLERCLEKSDTISLTPSRPIRQDLSFAVQESINFTPLKQPLSDFASPKPDFSLLTPMEPYSVKRSADHLTPLTTRFESSFGSTTRPQKTPTNIVNNVNSIVNKFFGATTSLTPTIIDRLVPADGQNPKEPSKMTNLFTQQIDTSEDVTPEFRNRHKSQKPISIPQFEQKIINPLNSPSKLTIPKDNDTLAIFANESADESAAAFLDKFDQSVEKKSTESICGTKVTTDMTFGFAKVDPTIIGFKEHTIDFLNFKTGSLQAPIASTRNILSGSGPYNPWSEEFIDIQMGQMELEIESIISKFLPKMDVNVGQHRFTHNELVGEGNFAKVYRYSSPTGGEVAVKVQKNPEPWEYIILANVQHRLANTKAQNSISQIINFKKHPNCGVMVTPFYTSGTLLELCAKAKLLLAKRSPTMKPFVLFFAAQLTALLVELHQENVIHGDFKPDNIMLRPIEDFGTAFTDDDQIQGVCLIDWGRAINCDAYSGAFVGKCYTSGFMCRQMILNKPWKFQVDLYALAMNLHIIMFGDYAKVNHNGGRSVVNSLTIPRHFDKREWISIFDTLMNYDQFDSPVETLKLRRDYFASQYDSLSTKEKMAFKEAFNQHISL